MALPLLQSKLFIPPARPTLVPRPRLIEQLNAGLHRKLALISAPAGFGKTTLVSRWVTSGSRPVAWLSLDEGESDPTRFLTYLVAALQTIEANIGEGVAGMLQGAQPPPIEMSLSVLLNSLAAVPEPFTLVLDDYHVIDAQAVDQALTFLLEHLPPQMHLVITTREDPSLPLARLRARGQLTELRAADLRFTPDEAATFLNQGMGLDLSAEEIAGLESRTEGWIAGLQLAALSMQGQKDVTGFIESFAGSHRFVLDYLVEEVLEQQPERVQTFLLRTSILDRLCGPLCDAVVRDTSAAGQATLETLERANLFLVPLDNERRWYRYHHLFADLLRQRLHQSAATGGEGPGVADYHLRASQWYEENGLLLEAFHHAAAANDVERAARLVEGEGMPLHFRGAVTPVLKWLEALPKSARDARPSLWVMYASALTFAGQQIDSIEATLQAAEAALSGAALDDKTRELIGHIAALRAMLAVPQQEVDTIVAQSRRALEFLHPNNLPLRTAASWTLGFAYQLLGERAAASQAYRDAIAVSEASGNLMITIAATTCLGQVQETEGQLFTAAESYRRVLHLAGDPPLPYACEAHLGLARVLYQWNDLEAAQQQAQRGIHLARQLENVDTPAVGELFLAHLQLTRGDADGAAAMLAQAEQEVRQRNFAHRMPDVAAAQVLSLLRQGNVEAAARLAERHDLPLSQARVHLAQGEPSTALALLEPLHQQAEAKGWHDERLKVLVLQAIAHHAQGEKEKAVRVLGDALALAAPGGFIRLFVDEGPPMAHLLSEAAARGVMPDYIGKLLAAFPAAVGDKTPPPGPRSPNNDLIEPLSDRELEVLHLIAEGLTNREIAARLYLSLNTVKVHTRNIYGKLGVHSRTQAAARGRALGLLPTL